MRPRPVSAYAQGAQKGLQATNRVPSDHVAFGRAFMDMDLGDLDNFDATAHTSLRDLFPIASKSDEPIIYIEDSSYEFSAKLDVIEFVEKNLWER
jgi:hypothetical protein